MRLVYCLLFLIATIPTQGQSGADKIYLPNGEAVVGTITTLTPQAIAYTAGSAEQSVASGQWVLAIKQSGEFALPGRAIWQAGADPKAHRIITRDGGIVTARSLTVEGESLTYLPIETPQRQSLLTQNVLLLIYRDGRHQLLAPPAEAARGLAQLQPTSNQPATSITTSPGDAEEGEVLVMDDEAKKQFESMALVKANDFGKYLSIVSNKDEVEEDKMMAVAHAVKLFMSDSSKIQVSSLNQSENQQYTVPVYLDRLRMLPYDKVELLWVKAQMVSKFRKGMDGRYYGMIAAQQLFRGYLDNQIVYQDVTEKDIEVVLDQYVVFDEGQQKKKWDVLLSSVNVKQTREK